MNFSQGTGPKAAPVLAHQGENTRMAVAEDPGQGPRQRRVDLPGDHQQQIAGAVVDPVVGAGGQPPALSPRLAMVGRGVSWSKLLGAIGILHVLAARSR